MINAFVGFSFTSRKCMVQNALSQLFDVYKPVIKKTLSFQPSTFPVGTFGNHICPPQTQTSNLLPIHSVTGD
jgi:hypothetical protein